MEKKKRNICQSELFSFGLARVEYLCRCCCDIMDRFMQAESVSRTNVERVWPNSNLQRRNHDLYFRVALVGARTCAHSGLRGSHTFRTESLAAGARRRGQLWRSRVLVGSIRRKGHEGSVELEWSEEEGTKGGARRRRRRPWARREIRGSNLVLVDLILCGDGSNSGSSHRKTVPGLSFSTAPLLCLPLSGILSSLWRTNVYRTRQSASMKVLSETHFQFNEKLLREWSIEWWRIVYHFSSFEEGSPFGAASIWERSVFHGIARFWYLVHIKLENFLINWTYARVESLATSGDAVLYFDEESFRADRAESFFSQEKRDCYYIVLHRKITSPLSNMK